MTGADFAFSVGAGWDRLLPDNGCGTEPSTGHPLALATARAQHRAEGELQCAYRVGDDEWAARAENKLRALDRLARLCHRPAPRARTETAVPNLRPVVSRARQRRSRRAATARATTSGDRDGEPPPPLRPFIAALADLILADLSRRPA